jgi:hypothetical protein
MSSCNNFSSRDIDPYMNRSYNSYSEYQSNYNEAKLNYLIRRKYLNLLGKFIENMYPGLKFDIYIQQRDPKVREATWYGYTYMELKIFDVITSPMYNPTTFTPVYRSPHCNETVNGEVIYELIEEFIPEINKHLLISFRPLIQPHLEIHNMNFYDIPDFECWGEYFSRDYRKNAMRPNEHYDWRI